MLDVMYELSLFSGYGGFSLGLRLLGLPVRTVGYVEIGRYCQEIIKARIKDGLLDDAPIFGDIRLAISTRELQQFRGLVDIITAGFPCQPHSVAGRRQGAADERDLWPETLTVIGQVGPRWVVLENVPGILANGYAGTVVGQLSELGYDCTWGVVSAAEVGAPHLRYRWWCLAYSNNKRYTPKLGEAIPRWRGQTTSDTEFGRRSPDRGTLFGLVRAEDVADPSRQGLAERQGQPENAGQEQSSIERGVWWKTKSGLGRVVDECPHRVDRLKALGNGIVPAQLAYALRLLSGMA